MWKSALKKKTPLSKGIHYGIKVFEAGETQGNFKKLPEYLPPKCPSKEIKILNHLLVLVPKLHIFTEASAVE